ncbi:MAG: complex I NDUFA9 subunit family protein [Methylocapsa sp.]|nr:complex I NDUFA9 subunit family protein [Methylocapsa sp.]
MGDELVKTDRLVTVFGGSGFLGRYVVRALASRGWRIRAASRRPGLALHLQPLGGTGQIHAVQANVRSIESVAHAMRDAQAAVNLVGILHQKGAQRFEAIHHFGAENIAKAAKQACLEVLVHVSAIGADPSSASGYAQTKAFGEAAARKAFPATVIMRPSVVFGPEDQFFNRFASMARFMPVLPLIGGGQTKLQPVFVGDVAEAIALAIEGKAVPGTVYELGGPEIVTLQQVISFVLSETQRRRILVPISFKSAAALAAIMEVVHKLSLGLLPEMFLITSDQVELLRSDNIVSALAEAEGRTLHGFSITPEPFGAFVPTYLYRYRKTGQFAGTPGG